MVDRAFDVIAETLADKTAPPALRLRAAEAVLDRAGVSTAEGMRSALLNPMFVELGMDEL